MLNFLFSTKTTLFLLIAFAGAMAAATFIENDYGSEVARALVYEAWWFEGIMIWLAVNFLTHIPKYRLFRPGRRPVGLFHLAFGIIILGAGVTRYFGKEGLIHIREGHAESVYYTAADYLQVHRHGDTGEKRFEKPVRLISRNFKPETFQIDFGEVEFTAVIEEYIAGAKEGFAKGDETFIEVAVAIGGGREDFLLTPGEEIRMGTASLGTHADASNPVRIFKQDTSWMIQSDLHLQVMDMSTQNMGFLHAGEKQNLQLRSLYQWEGGAFVIKAVHENARLQYLPERDEEIAKDLPGAMKIKVEDEHGATVTQTWLRLTNLNPAWHSFDYEGVSYSITYGPKAESLPFALHLSAFELERYPGSQSPSGYASELVVKDGEKEFPYRVFMNNVLDYRGFRFYQASYDTDEKGTVLSVSRDRPGTYLTYLGYFLLGLGMFLTLFAKGSRFQLLNKKLGELKSRTAVIAGFMLASGSLAANGLPYPGACLIPIEKADEYGKLIVQDLDGRMKPLNTLANEITRKLGGKPYVIIPTGTGEIKLTPEQFLLAVQLDPEGYSDLPLIKIHPKKSAGVFARLGIASREKLSFRDFLDGEGAYLLHDLVEEANRLKPGERNEGHKELLKTDERFNIFYALLTGDFLRLFPNKSDKNNTWFTAQQFMQGFDEEDAVFVKNITAIYLKGLDKGIRSGDWSEADEAHGYIRLFQQKAGKAVYPTENLIRAELLYNRLRLGNRLFGLFWLLGTIMLGLGIAMLFRKSNVLQNAWTIGKILSWFGFLAFTFHLGLRWYVAGRPPWTDGFEMLVFAAWGILLFGLLFSGKSRFTIPLALLFSGVLLFVSFLDWLNPEITNLMPVLHSYWLKIHVAVIVSGYAPRWRLGPSSPCSACCC
jgi:hypothetical protein